jgi:prephenate dehydratase
MDSRCRGADRDRPDNTTRFLVLSLNCSRPRATTALRCWSSSRISRALFNVGAVRRHGSHEPHRIAPRAHRSLAYAFFIDITGHAQERDAPALDEGEFAQEVKVLGSIRSRCLIPPHE